MDEETVFLLFFAWAFWYCIIFVDPKSYSNLINLKVNSTFSKTLIPDSF